MRTTLACTLAAAVAGGAALTFSTQTRAATDTALVPTSGYLLGKIDRWRRRTWYWQHVMGTRRWPTAHNARKTRSLAYRQWALRLWKHRAVRARHRALRPPHRQAWLCIHRHEGAWHSNTGNGFYGGLQMNLSFQQHYGRWLLRVKGRAHHWTPVEQIWVAERARRSRGWYPWPATARACGLI